MTDPLSNVFGTEPHEITMELDPLVVPKESESPEDADYDFARSNYYELINQGRAAVNTAMHIAAETQNPRAIEVLSGLMKNMADVNKQLVQLAKDKADVKAAKKELKTLPQQAQIGTQTNNIIMTGSLKDVTRLIKDQNLQNIIENE